MPWEIRREISATEALSRCEVDDLGKELFAWSKFGLEGSSSRLA